MLCYNNDIFIIIQGGITSEMNTIEGQQEWRKRPRKLQKTNEVVRPCDEDEKGAHSEKNA